MANQLRRGDERLQRWGEEHPWRAAVIMGVVIGALLGVLAWFISQGRVIQMTPAEAALIGLTWAVVWSIGWGAIGENRKRRRGRRRDRGG